jgi:hypothetical protein
MTLQEMMEKTGRLAGVSDAGAIREALTDASNEIIRTNPPGGLRPRSVAPSTSPCDGGTVITLPPDFACLSFVRLRGWERGLSEAAPCGSESYALQHNPYTRAGASKPVAVFSGGGEMECYPAGETEAFRYIPIAAVAEDCVSLLAPEVQSAACYLAAAILLDIGEQAEAADRLRQIANNLLPPP